MRTSTLLAALATAALCTSAWSKGPTPMEEAHHEYYLEHYARSLAVYQKLAAAGNAEAAERAGFMLFQGDTLYGRQVKRDPERARALLTQAAMAGRAGAGFMLNMLERTD